MSAASVAARGRRSAEARMDSIVTVRRRGAKQAQNEETGDQEYAWTDIYTGPFRLGGADRGGSGTRTLNVGGVELQVATRVGHFPAETTGLADGDLIDVTAGENAGVVLRIVEADWQDQSTARRVPVVSTDRPTEWA